jgi:hypothetical protein
MRVMRGQCGHAMGAARSQALVSLELSVPLAIAGLAGADPVTREADALAAAAWLAADPRGTLAVAAMADPHAFGVLAGRLAAAAWLPGGIEYMGLEWRVHDREGAGT